MLVSPSPTPLRLTSSFTRWAISPCFNANSARRLAAVRPTCVFTFKNSTHPISLSSVNAAPRSFPIAIRSSCTRKLTRERSAIAVRSVHTLQSQHVISSRTCLCIRIRSHSSAPTAIRASVRSSCSSDTRTSIIILTMLQRRPKRRHTFVQRAAKAFGIKAI